MKTTTWTYHYPGMIYPGELYFNKPVSETVARDKLRNEYNSRRLPNNTTFWIQSTEDKKIIRKSNANFDFINE